HLPFFTRIGTQGVSSDESESDDEEKRPTHTMYVRITPVWCSRRLSNWMWSLDDIALNQRAPRVGTRAVPGAEPRQRKHSTRVNMVAVAPPYLFRNCYDQTWLGTLLDYDKRNLHTMDLDYDL
ncbi:hypothetical protein OF83DRAFT_1039626, partial [Amylostereum chailletii]